MVTPRGPQRVELLAGSEPARTLDFPTPPDWMRDALCREYPHVTFFPDKGQAIKPALQVCAKCICMMDCRAWAIADPSLDHGVLGGMDVQARKAARKLAALRVASPSPAPSSHGDPRTSLLGDAG